MLFICYPKCSTCKKAQKWLDEHGLSYEFRDIKEDNPTLEELMEIITWKQLGLFLKPIVIVNVNHFFDPLLAMLDKCVGEKFMSEKLKKTWTVVNRADEVLTAIEEGHPWGEEESNKYASL